MSERILTDVTCLGCGCLCDDLQVTIDGNEIAAVQRACELGERWLRTTASASANSISGVPSSLSDALERAAQLLTTARAPLVYGLDPLSVAGQQAAVALAERLGATLDTPTSVLHGPTGMTFQGVGEVTCTLGEVRHRGDLLVFWRADPDTTHPRYAERYALDSPGMFLPNGRADRRSVVIDSVLTETAENADRFIALPPGCDFAAIWTLRALVQRLPLDADQVRRQTSVELSVWKDLADELRSAHFGVLIHDEQLTLQSGGRLNLEALQGLARDLSAHTRAVVTALRGGGNPTGADNVVLWQTGYPAAVNFAHGYPRYQPGETSAVAGLERGEFDVVVLIGTTGLDAFSERARVALERLPIVSISATPSPWHARAAVSLAHSRLGLATSGTVYRMDEVPLPLRVIVPSELHSDVEVLESLLSEIARRQYAP